MQAAARRCEGTPIEAGTASIVEVLTASLEESGPELQTESEEARESVAKQKRIALHELSIIAACCKYVPRIIC